jgi:hypothetical protein
MGVADPPMTTRTIRMRTSRKLILAGAAASAILSASAGAQGNVDKLTLHGFLNQGYGLSGPIPVLGLNKDATGDYRAAALQVRYAISPVDNFVVQAGSRSLGTSPFTSPSGSVTLDWAFYHHRFDLASLRVGRVPVPFGFLSETREVATLLPFYRAPANYYLESYRSLDGAMLTNDLPFAGGVLETSLFAGGTNGSIVTWLPTTVITTKLRFERLIGGELTYTTPIDGIRIRGGLAGLRSLDTAKVQLAPATKITVLSGGVDASFDRVLARGEWRRLKIASNQRQYSYYAQTGVRLLDKLWLNGQGDFSMTENYTAAVNDYVGRTSADRAAALSYQFRPNIVGKLEQHWAKGGVDAFVAPTAETPYTTYSIASVAVSF